MYDLNQFEVHQDLSGGFAWKQNERICLGIHLKQFSTIFLRLPTDAEISCSHSTVISVSWEKLIPPETQSYEWSVTPLAAFKHKK